MRTPARLRTMILAALALLPAAAFANYLGDVSLEHGTAAYLGYGEQVEVSFSFKVDDAQGGRIMVLPYTHGSPTPAFSWQGSILYLGEGTGERWFSVSSGAGAVDQIFVGLYSEDWTELKLEMYIPVDYHFGDNGVFNIGFSHLEHSFLPWDTDLTVTFDYVTDEADGVLIWARPYRNGALCPGYSASGSPLYGPPSGSGDSEFHFPGQDSDMDEIRIVMKNADQTETLLDFFVPLDMHWREHGVMNMRPDWSAPQSFAWPQHLVVEFDYQTSDPNGARVWIVGAKDGVFALDQYFQSSSLVYGSGTTTRYLFFDGIAGEIDQFMVIMTDDNQTVTYLEEFVPAGDYYWNEHGFMNVTLEPGAPAILDTEERVDVYCDYVTTDPDGVRIYNFPWSQGAVNPYWMMGGSPLWYGTGTGNNFFSLSASGEGSLVDQVGMDMRDADQTTIYLEFLVPAWHFFGPSTVVTGVETEQPAAAVAMAPNYPNPFNPSTTLRFHLAYPAEVDLAIYDVRGRRIRELAVRTFGAGDHELVWDGRDGDGRAMPSGIYLARLMAADQRLTQKLVLVK